MINEETTYVKKARAAFHKALKAAGVPAKGKSDREVVDLVRNSKAALAALKKQGHEFEKDWGLYGLSNVESRYGIWDKLRREFPDWEFGDLKDAALSVSPRMSREAQKVQKRYQELRKQFGEDQELASALALFVEATPGGDKELVRMFLSYLPKKAQYNRYADAQGQEQYWFDLGIAFSDWAYRTGMKKGIYDMEKLWEPYFKALLGKLKKKLPPEIKPVVRGHSIVFVVEE